jgi:hypothetical protein
MLKVETTASGRRTGRRKHRATLEAHIPEALLALRSHPEQRLIGLRHGFPGHQGQDGQHARYQLFGEKCREGVSIYHHADGRDRTKSATISKNIAQGVKNIP